jgi:hypothetical protein
MAASIPCIAEEGKKSPKAPILKKPKITSRTPEITIAARVNKYPWYAFPSPKMVIAERITTTNPFPGPVIVTLDPPIKETTIPPTIAAIIPEIGGAPEANASPKPNGSAIKETTNPEKRFCGISPKNVLKGVVFCIYFTIKTSVGNSDKIYSRS